LIDLGSNGYNAGNEFIEALAQYRYDQLQLPALCISLPAVSGTGMFHRQKDLLTSLHSSQGLETLPTAVIFEVVERLFNTQTNGVPPVIFAVNWQALNIRKDHLPSHQLAEIIEKQANLTGVSERAGCSSDHHSMATIEIIVERTRATTMRLLGMSTIDRIDINHSLLSQGMDSLAAVSLFNWLTQEWDVIISLAEIFQGISIQQIANQVHSKLKDRVNVAAMLETTTSINMEKLAMTEGTLESFTTNKVLLYNGMERVLSILPIKDSKSIVFYISTRTDVTAKPIIDPADNKSTVYVLHAPTYNLNMELCVHEIIAQIRRLQPRGPYSLLPIDNESIHVVHAIVKQLEHYVQAGANHHF
jgi:acyl carrier protein